MRRNNYTLLFYGSLAAILMPAVSDTVDCDHNTEVCDCGTPSDGVCEFTLEIEHLQTFTKYEIVNDKRGNTGRVWYVDQITGNLKPHPQPEDGACSTEDDPCTEAYTVDGYTFRSFIAVNGRFHGPTLIVNKDDYVVVNVINRLASESISVHWHGMHQRNSHWMDGVERVTQCGILPGTSFTYVFQAEQSGTHWYHSHSGAQRTEGLFGALIVKESEARLSEVKENVGEFEDIPENHTLTFLDWQNENSIDLFTQIRSGIRFFEASSAPNDETKVLPRTYSSDEAEVGPVTYWSGLINGRGRHKDVDYIQSRLSIFTVKPNKVYRFRLIGAQSLYAYRVSIDEHKLTVIASDGAFVKPLEVDYIIIHSGERYDFLLNTSASKSKSDFMIRAETLETYSNIFNKASATTNIAEAILHYDTGSNSLPSSSNYQSISDSSVSVESTCSATSPCTALNCPFEEYPSSEYINCNHVHELNIMFPVSTEDGLPDVSNDQKLFFNFGFEGTRNSSAINARNMELPSLPLTQLLSDNAKQSEIDLCSGLDDSTVCDDVDSAAVISPECTCTHLVGIYDNQSVQLVLSAVAPKNASSERSINNSRFAHPVHLHGHYFHVVDIQFGEYDEDGALTKLNEDIDCSGTNLCTKPQWANGIDKDYSTAIQNAPQKDTIFIPFGGYAVVYFTPNNPGYWFLHCHIEVHQLEGMGVIIGEAVDKSTSPPEGMPVCGNFDFDIQSFKSARNTGTTDSTKISTKPPPGNTDSTESTQSTESTESTRSTESTESSGTTVGRENYTRIILTAIMVIAWFLI